MNPGTGAGAPALLAQVVRGEVVEAVHRGHAAVVDAAGRLLCAAGDPDRVTYMRSAAKPFQAAAVVESGAADRFGLGDRELAVACASHNAEPEHLEAVRALLRKAGVGEEALECGVHPLRPVPGRALPAVPDPQPIHNNCSGKHAGMLALARHRGWPLAGYTARDHPVQREMLRCVAAAAGLAPAEVAVGTDGCGVPTFALPVRRIALAFACLVRPDEAPALPAGHGGALLRDALHRVRQAMAAQPFLVAGTGRFCTDLAVATGGRLVGKVGAEGVYGVAVVDMGWGLAVKVEDGANRGLYPAVMRILEDLGLLLPHERERLAAYAAPVVRNRRGETVGAVRSVPTLAPVAWEPAGEPGRKQAPSG